MKFSLINEGGYFGAFGWCSIALFLWQKGRCKGSHRDRKQAGTQLLAWAKWKSLTYRQEWLAWRVLRSRQGTHYCCTCTHRQWGMQSCNSSSAPLVYTNQNTCADLLSTAYSLICLVNKLNAGNCGSKLIGNCLKRCYFTSGLLSGAKSQTTYPVLDKTNWTHIETT